MSKVVRLGAHDPVTVRTAVDIPLSIGGRVLERATFHTFTGLSDGREHLAIGLGDTTTDTPLVRMHSECLTSEVFGSRRCDCAEQLREAIDRIAEQGGYLLYLRQEGRGIGLYNKLDAYALQLDGMDTYEANLALGLPMDGRDYTVAVEMLRALQVHRFDLLTNNPDKVAQLRNAGMDVAQVQPTDAFLTEQNRNYLIAKVAKTSHTIRLENVA